MRDFVPAYDRSGSVSTFSIEAAGLLISAGPQKADVRARIAEHSVTRFADPAPPAQPGR
jgi:hypothetical protein